jgi:alkylation response protein AidB-like acyl-CoA dehydrogenase
MAGIAAMGAEAIGAMEAMHEMTQDYLKTRKQFGRPIGDNQVLRHKAADMLVALEQGRSLSMLAAMTITSRWRKWAWVRPAASSVRTRCRCMAASA